MVFSYSFSSSFNEHLRDNWESIKVRTRSMYVENQVDFFHLTRLLIAKFFNSNVYINNNNNWNERELAFIFTIRPLQLKQHAQL